VRPGCFAGRGSDGDELLRQPLRILLVAHAFPPRSTAGVEVYTLRLAQALVARGHAVRVLTAVHDLAPAPYTIRERVHEGVAVTEIVSVHQRGTLEATYEDAAIDAAGAALLREFRPQCVHFQHLLNLSSGLLGAARASGARIVFTLHDYWLSCPRDGLRMREDLSICTTMDHGVCATCMAGSPYLVPPLQRGLAGAVRRAGLGRHLHRLHDLAPRMTETALGWLRRASPAPSTLAAGMDRRAATLRRAAENVDLFLAPTSFMRDRAIDFGVPAEKVRLFPYGVLRQPPRGRRAGARRRFGFVGTLAPHKGAHVLVGAFRGVADPDLTLDLHGSLTVQPSYVAALRRAAAGDERIHFHGFFGEGEQDRVFGSLDALVVPSVWWENSPIVVIEALAAGLAVIASRTGGVPELIPEGAGLLVPPGDPAALREAIALVGSGARLAEAQAPVPQKTTNDEARELEALYA
jgi:glycosyltransferase involved in cell wall biosynthesis